MSSTPFVVSARHLGGHRLEVELTDGTRKQIEFSRWLDGPVFAPLRDVDYFSRFILDGWTVAWPNGVDIAPETLYRFVEGEEAAA